jgi:LysR family transcriptional regulator, chromosome initiation inhibitor
MNLHHLRALTAVIDERTFEAAADALGVTASAVSQRIKALETSVGQVVVRRGAPCTATEAGTVLLRMARQVQFLESEARDALGGQPSARAVTRVAVNADSLATWFVAVLSEAALWPDVTLDLRVEDEGFSKKLLRQGDVIGAVTSDPAPINGCRVQPLGSMRYLPMAAASLCERFPTDGGPDWARMPMLEFNAKDDLQRRVLRANGVAQRPPTHSIPSSDGFLAAVRAGLGWGMLPEVQAHDGRSDGSLVLLMDHGHQDVALCWQTWTLDSERLGRLSRAIVQASRDHLRTA